MHSITAGPWLAGAVQRPRLGDGLRQRGERLDAEFPLDLRTPLGETVDAHYFGRIRHRLHQAYAPPSHGTQTYDNVFHEPAFLNKPLRTSRRLL